MINSKRENIIHIINLRYNWERQVRNLFNYPDLSATQGEIEAFGEMQVNKGLIANK